MNSVVATACPLLVTWLVVPRCILRNWSIVANDRRPGGAAQERLVGYVYGHPGQADGTWVVTSIVVRRDNHIAVTKSGTEYELQGCASAGVPDGPDAEL